MSRDGKNRPVGNWRDNTYSPWHEAHVAEIDAAKAEGRDMVCVRCGEVVPDRWRHFHRACRTCALLSVAACSFVQMFGLNGRPWLYWGSHPECPVCEGLGWLPCEPQDMTFMRKSGACTTCGAWSFELWDTRPGGGLVPDSGRHADPTDEPDHAVVVGGAPLVRALDETLTEATG